MDERNPLTETLLVILEGPPGTAKRLAGGAFRSLVAGALTALSSGIQDPSAGPKRGRVAPGAEKDETPRNRR